MDQNLHGIGELAALSGLSVSALRFYDGAGVLRPAQVDPVSGYRKYAADQVAVARLVARLRRVGLPLAGLRQVLAGPAALSVEVLDRHLRRLEDGLADARRELSTVRALLDTLENTMTCTAVLPIQTLLDAIAEVRFAASADPELPMLAGLLLDLDTDRAELRLVATDRFRLAVSTAEPSSITGQQIAVLMPIELIDRAVTEFSTASGSVTVAGSVTEVSFTVGATVVRGTPLPHEFPDYQRLVRPAGNQQFAITAGALRELIEQAPTRTMIREQDGQQYQTSVLHMQPSGALALAAAGSDGGSIGLNREFLLQALDAGRADQLLLDLDGPIRPLAIRDADRAGSYSILMPVRL